MLEGQKDRVQYNNLKLKVWKSSVEKFRGEFPWENAVEKSKLKSNFEDEIPFNGRNM